MCNGINRSLDKHCFGGAPLIPAVATYQLKRLAVTRRRRKHEVYEWLGWIADSPLANHFLSFESNETRQDLNCCGHCDGPFVSQFGLKLGGVAWETKFNFTRPGKLSTNTYCELKCHLVQQWSVVVWLRWDSKVNSDSVRAAITTVKTAAIGWWFKYVPKIGSWELCLIT